MYIHLHTHNTSIDIFSFQMFGFKNTLNFFLFFMIPLKYHEKKERVFTLGKALSHILYWINRPMLNATSHTPLERFQGCSVWDSRQKNLLRKSQNVPV